MTELEMVALVRDLAAIKAVDLRVLGQGPLDWTCMFCRAFGQAQSFVHEPTCVWQRAVDFLAQSGRQLRPRHDLQGPTGSHHATPDDYVRQLEDAALILWGVLPTKDVLLLREENPELVEFLRHLHYSIDHVEAMVRKNVWAGEAP